MSDYRASAPTTAVHGVSAAATDPPSVWHWRAALGTGIVATVCALAAVATGEVDRVTAIYYLSTMLALAGVWLIVRRLPWPRLLLAWPLILMVGMSGAAYLAPLATSLCLGSLVTAFLFVGLTQPRGTSLVLLPFALLTMALAGPLPPTQEAVRLTVAGFIWISAAELPAWLVFRLGSAHADMRRLASTDSLTGLANRRMWEDRLAMLLDSSAGAAVLLVDLDRFKDYNDRHGHLAGDDLLVEFARVLAELTPEGDVAARWGGEEFAMTLRDAETAIGVAERLRCSVPAGQTCSIGLAVARPGESADSIMRRADAALYQAKRDGRNRLVAVGPVGARRGTGQMSTTTATAGRTGPEKEHSA
jgi:diguanylate cyclase (GGDEF)-like protein